MNKFEIRLPDYQVAAVEKMSRKKRIPRGRVIKNTINRYLGKEALSKEILRYVEGYRRKPERSGAVAFTEATTAVLSGEKRR